MGSQLSRPRGGDSGEENVNKPPEKLTSESSKTDILQNQFYASPEKPKTPEKPKRLEEKNTSEKPERMSDARKKEILREMQLMQKQLERNKKTIEKNNGNQEF